MSKETAEEYLKNGMSTVGFNSTQVRHYGDLRAQEEREKLLAELRSVRADVWLGISSYSNDAATSRHVGDLRYALAIAKQEGMEKERNARQLDYADGFEEGRRMVLEALEHGHSKTCRGDYDKGTPCDCPGADIMGAFDEAVESAKRELLKQDPHEWLNKQARVRATRGYPWWPEDEISEALARARAQGAADELEQLKRTGMFRK